MRFGEYIAQLRTSKRLTLSSAARELGITPQRLCDIEQGRRNFQRHPPMALLRKIAAVYDHPYANLVNNTEFFQYEKAVLSELLDALNPVANDLDAKALAMVIEARQYTPEMEALAVETHKLAQAFKIQLLLAKSKHSRGARERDGGEITTPKMSKTG